MKRLILIFCFCIHLISWAQGPSEDPCVRELLSEYVRLTNDNMHALWLFHNKLEAFNFELNAFHEASPNEQGSLRISFQHENFLRLATHYPSGMTPEVRYRYVVGKESCVPELFREPLNKHISQIREILQEVTGLSEQLDSYTRNGEYRLDPDQQRAYGWLSRCYVLYHDISVIKDALYYELNKLYRETEDPDPDNAFARSTRSLMAVIVPARAILKSLKANNSRMVSSNIGRLQTAVDRAQSEMATNFKGLIVTDPNNDPRNYYSYVTGLAEDLRIVSNEFVNLPDFPDQYQKHGKAYYYYNYKHLQLYDRFGEGMIERYNLLVDAADIPLLKMVEEPVLFKVILPDEQRQDAPDPQTPVVTATPEPEKPKDTVKTEVVVAPPTSVPPPRIENAAPINFVFLLDVSSSMEAKEKLPLLKTSFKYLITQMRPQDRVAIVTYSGKAQVALPSTSSIEKNRIMAAIDGLRSEGQTDALEGTILAYRVAQKSFIENGNNRIIMASDGYFRIPEALPRLISERVNEQDIRLSVFYFGQPEERAMERLERLAGYGKGNFRYISAENATAMLIEEANAVKMGD